ncbi:MAG: SDR family oxidoreductase [Bacteroidetes bacterium]|nr:SDR family oxidoreductase [Bacteroidota bacterium]MDA1336618.1 SDR family oxidoreductase [Bacteroidota bacterium]
MNWSGKTVWVTGASSGIGKATAHAWVKKGARLILSSRKRDALEESMADWTDEERDRSCILELDLADSPSLPEKVQTAISWNGQIDVMVHCGGISQRSLAIETDLSVDRKVMEVDYFGTVALTKALLPHFVDRKQGHFVVVTSLMGLFSSPLRSGYCGAKHALHGFFEALRAEHHSDKIGITMVCPGFIRTQISLNAVVGDGSQQGTMDEKTGAGMSPEDCAKRLIRAVERNKPEVLIGNSEIAGAYLKRFFPNVLRKVMRKAAVT